MRREAVYAYERVLFGRNGRKTRASRTWQIIERRGIIPAVERLVARIAKSPGFTALVQMGMQDKAFDVVVLRHPHLFSPEALRRSKERLDRL